MFILETEHGPMGGDEINLIKGMKSSEIERILGYKYSDEIINRDNMVLM